MPSSPKKHNKKVGYDDRKQAFQRGYDSDWTRLSKKHKRANPICVRCKERGIISSVSITDHIIPVHIRPDMRLAWNNLQSLCRSCHAIKTNEDLKKYGSASVRKWISGE